MSSISGQRKRNVEEKSVEESSATSSLQNQAHGEGDFWTKSRNG